MNRIFSLVCFTLIAWSMPSNAQDLIWHNPQSEEFHTVGGQGWPAELKGTYNRIPDRCEGATPKDVFHLSRQSAGLYIKFRTDSPVIKVRYGLTGGIQMQHMPATGVSGVDLYSMDERKTLRWCATGHRREFRDTAAFTYDGLTYSPESVNGYEYTMYLPLYNHVIWMEVGTSAGSHFEFIPSSCCKPIVIYGTSIAQGACATRTGLAWTNIIQRDFQADVVNLGFSGNGKMEPEMFNLLGEIDASVFVIDCMANMDGTLTPCIYERTVNGIRLLRSKTDAPVILVEFAGYSNMASSGSRAEKVAECNRELDRAYRTLIGEGVSNLYLIPHDENAYSIDEMVEGIHPNDIGMMHQARVTGKYIRIATGR